MQPDVRIRVVPNAERASALWFVFDWETRDARAQRVASSLEAMAANSNSSCCLLEAVRAERRVGTVFAQLAAGRLANFWPPVVLADEDEVLKDRLIQELEPRITSAGTTYAQTLLPPYAEHTASSLLRAGFTKAARLLFLGCDLSNGGPFVIATSVQFEPYSPDQLSRLVQLIDQTYTDSLDAPFLNGLRSTCDVVNGYRLTGNHSPEHWFFVRRENRDIGCLLLTDHSLSEQFELIYMGLIPSARGNNFGQQIANFALHQTFAAGRRAIVLGVDEANLPAIAMYRRCGFFELDRRLVLIKKYSLP